MDEKIEIGGDFDLKVFLRPTYLYHEIPESASRKKCQVFFKISRFAQIFSENKFRFRKIIWTGYPGIDPDK